MGETADALRRDDLSDNPATLGDTSGTYERLIIAPRSADAGSDDTPATTAGVYDVTSARTESYDLSASAVDSGEPTPADSGATDETEAIRADIEQTRSEMSATIDAIQEKLNPQNIVDQAKETVREATVGRVEQMVNNATDTARDTGASVMDTIQQNPVPVALLGLGLGWLLTKGGGNNGGSQRDSSSSSRSNAGRYPGGQSSYALRDAGWDRQGESYRQYDANNGNQGQNPIGQLANTVRQNPLPAALAGLGVWWLMNRSGGSSSNRSRYEPDYRGYQEPGAIDQAKERAGQAVSQVQDTAGQAVSQVQDTAGQVASTVGDKASQVASTVGDTAGQVASTVGDTAGQVASGVQNRVGDLANETQYRAYQAKNQLQRMMDDSPMMVGLLAAAAGAAIGLALPETPQEHQLMGEMRDNLLDKAQEAAQNTMQKVQQVATEAQQTVQEEAQAQGLTASA